MAVLTAAAAMATVTIEVEKRPPIMTSLCVAVRDCDELFFEQLDRWYRSWAHKKMLDWSLCHPLTAPACIADPDARGARIAAPARRAGDRRGRSGSGLLHCPLAATD